MLRSPAPDPAREGIAIENVLKTSNTPLSSVIKANLLSIISSNYLTSINTLQSLINEFKLTSEEKSINNA